MDKRNSLIRFVVNCPLTHNIVTPLGSAEQHRPLRQPVPNGSIVKNVIPDLIRAGNAHPLLEDHQAEQDFVVVVAARHMLGKQVPNSIWPQISIHE